MNFALFSLFHKNLSFLDVDNSLRSRLECMGKALAVLLEAKPSLDN